MASSASSHQLKHSKKNSTTSTVQVLRDDPSPNERRSRKSPIRYSPPSTKNKVISRRRSTTDSTSRYSRISKTSRTSQRSRSNLTRSTLEDDDEGEDGTEDMHIDNLNISSTSAATDNMDTSQQHDLDQSLISVDNNNGNNQNDKKKLSKNELIKQYFTRLNTGGYYCKLCRDPTNSKKVHKQISYSDANLRSHLARKHKLTHLLYPSQRSQYQIKSQSLPSDFKKQLDDALIYAIIKDSRPFGDFRKTGFQHFLQTALPNMNYKGPHRSTVKNHMKDMYISYRAQLIKEFSSVNDIALTTDAWSSPRRVHFICITAHYYDKEYHYISKVISFRRFVGRNFALRIRQFIRVELIKLKIDKKICSITTDNGPNIKLATNTKEFGIRIPCLIHGIQLTVVGGLGLWITEKKKKSGVQITTEDSKEEEEEEEDEGEHGFNDIDEEDETNEDDIENSESSDDEVSNEETADVHPYSDNLDKEYTSSDDKTEDEEPRNQQSERINFNEHETEYVSTLSSQKVIFKLLQRTRDLISTINNSSNIDRYVEDQIYVKQHDADKRAKEDNSERIIYNKLIKDMCIRWGSTFKMLHRFNLLSSVLNEITCTPRNIDGVNSQQVLKLSKLTFTHDDWNLLSALEIVLERFDYSTQLLSGRSYQTLSLGKMILTGLKHFLLRREPGEPLINHLKSLLLPKFEEYCGDNLSPDVQEAIIIGSFLNPTTYFFLQEDEQFIKKAKQLIVIKSKTEKFSSKHSSSINLTQTTQAHPTTNKKASVSIEAFLRKCEAPLPTRITTSTTTKTFNVQQEIGYYISSIDKTTEFQEYWKKNEHHLPILSRLVRHYCVMPMTSISSESAFSIAGYIQRKHRCSLSATTLRYSMLLRDSEPDHFNSSD